MNEHLSPSTRLALCMTVVAVLLAGAAAAGGQTAGATEPQSPAIVDEQEAAAMMAERRKMMANLRAMDQKLKELVARIDAATDDAARIDAIAAVVKELVAQRTEMHGRMEALQARMMEHMMKHVMSMQGGMGMMRRRGQTGTMQPMSNCPMMKELAREAAQADEPAHHPGQ